MSPLPPEVIAPFNFGAIEPCKSLPNIFTRVCSNSFRFTVKLFAVFNKSSTSLPPIRIALANWSSVNLPYNNFNCPVDVSPNGPWFLRPSPI